MPYNRPTLTDLNARVAQDIRAQLPGTDPLLRVSNLGILGRVQARLAHFQYAFLDWIARQAVPVTAEGEYLAAWGALKDVTRRAPNQASGSIQFPATVGATVPAGASISRSDGALYVSTDAAVADSSGTVTVPAQAIADPAGLVGLAGNCAAGTIFALASPFSGVTSTGAASTAFTGGADIESESDFHARVMLAYRTPAHGGSDADYLEWALAVPGVTQAWVKANGQGLGTVVVYILMQAGMPSGTNGVATAETRDVAATGDQLAVANALYSEEPATALVYACAPVERPIDVIVAGLATASPTVKANVTAALAAAIRGTAEVAGVVGLDGATLTAFPLSVIEATISSVPGTTGFLITSPLANIPLTVGQYPTPGSVTFV